MSDRKSVLAVAGVAAALAVALVTAPFWAYDVVVLSVGALAIVEYCFSKVEAPSWMRVRKPDISSRVYRYSIIEKSARANSGSYLLDNSKVPLLTMPELRALPKEDLMDLDSKLKEAR